MTEKPDETPIMEIVDKLKDPINSLTEEEKSKVKALTGDVSSAVKSSLIQLLMGQFSKVEAYNGAIDAIMRELLNKTAYMETDELIALLSVLTKTSTSASKNVMDIFKKQGDDLKSLIEELQKLSKKDEVIDDNNIKGSKKPKAILHLSDQKKDKLLRLVNALADKKLQEEDTIVDAEVEEVEEE